MWNIERQLLANQIDVDSLANGVVLDFARTTLVARDGLLRRIAALGNQSLTSIRQQEILLMLDAVLLQLLDRHAADLTGLRREVILAEIRTVSRTLAEARLAMGLPAAPSLSAGSTEVARAIVAAVGQSSREPAGTVVRLPGEAAVAGSAAVAVAGTGPVARLAVKDVEVLLRSEILGTSLADAMGTTRAAVVDAARKAMAAEALKGSGTASVAKVLRDSFAIARTRADIIARTALLDAANRAREQTYSAFAEVIASYTFLATLDSRTCMVCGVLDGRTEPEYHLLPPPPVHPRCRCIIRPNTSFPNPNQTRPAVVEATSHTTQHRDGSTSTKWRPTRVRQVPGSMTYRQFFESQPEAWQRDVLGHARFKLYKEGRLSLEDLVASGSFSNYRVIRVSELRQRG